MSQENEPDLIFTVSKEEAPEHFKKFWETFWIYYAETFYRDVKYKAWGTDEAEAKKKIYDLIASDKTNGIIRNPGDVVE